MGSGSQRYQRKILFIKKEFQARVIAIILLSVFVFANVSLSLMVVFMTGFFADQSINELIVSEKFFTMFVPSMLVIETIGLLLILYLGLFISHRMAGPIYRLEKCAAQIESGDLSFDVRIRPYDEFQEMASAMDSMVKGLRGKLLEIRGIFSSVRQSEKLVDGHLEKNDIEKARKEFGEMVFLIESLEELISEFKLEQNSDTAAGKQKSAEKETAP